MKKEILYITNLPAPYKINYFNELGKYTDLTVVFERSTAKNRNAAWTSFDSVCNFNAVFLSGINFGNEMCVDISIVKVLAQYRNSLVFLNGYSSPTEMLAIQYMKVHKIPFVLVCDGLLVKKEPSIVKRLKRALINSASYWMSSGRETDTALINHGADLSRIYRYPFSSIRKSDIAKIPYCRAHYKRAIGCKSTRMILYVGQMIQRKGIDLLLEAVKNINIDFQLYMIGDRCPFSDQRVVNIGFLNQSELKNYYMAADLFVLPSREDIWGLVINEAMGYGVPVVATDRCGAALEMIKNGYNGAIVPANNVAALQEKIVSILQEDGSEAYMYDAIRTAQSYTIEKMAERTWEIICEIWEGE